MVTSMCIQKLRWRVLNPGALSWSSGLEAFEGRVNKLRCFSVSGFRIGVLRSRVAGRRAMGTFCDALHCRDCHSLVRESRTPKVRPKP